MKIESLLGLGMMPAQMSPAFTSRGFADLGPALVGLVATPKEGFDVTRHNMARPGGLRRRLEMPNPFAYLELARVCAADWERLRRLSARSAVSVTRPLVDPRGIRAVAYLADLRAPQPRLSERTIGARYTLHTDISSFYDSIYTHSLDWAIQGKESAKRNFARRKPRNTLGRRVDQAFQRARSRQTSGISVGPDTSTMVSEVLLASIDHELATRIPRYGTHGYRYVDDVVFYARSQSEAEAVLGEWQTLLSEFELSVNPMKTRIVHGPSPIREPWIISLAHARLRDSSDRVYCADLEDLFSLAFDLRRAFPQKSVLAYAIKRANPFPLGPDSWKVFVDFLLTSSVLEPSTLRHVHDVLQFGAVRGMVVPIETVAQSMNQIIQEHAPLDHGSEVAWALTILRELGARVEAEAATMVVGMTDNASLLLLRDMFASGLVVGSPDFTEMEERARGAEALAGANWLLAYELARLGYASDWHVRRAAGWKQLRQGGVEFFVGAHAQPKPRLTRRKPSFITTLNWVYT